MRNTAHVIGGKPIVVQSQFMSDMSADEHVLLKSAIKKAADVTGEKPIVIKRQSLSNADNS
jgi:hypothetical protein